MSYSRRHRRTPTASWHRAVGLVLLGAVQVSGCRCDESRSNVASTASAAASASSGTPSPSGTTAQGVPEPTSLLALPTSAYRASLALDDEAVYVLTEKAVHRIVVGGKAERIPLELGFSATATTHSFIFWSEGAIWEVSKHGGKPERLGFVPHQPQKLVSSGSRFAWVDRSEAGQFTIQAIQNQEPRVLHTASGQIDAVTMADDVVVFVERTGPRSWRLGRVRTSEGKPTFAATQQGRTPAMLAAFGNAIYYQDVNGLRVVELSLDLQRERVLAENFVCSPLAVWESVYCCQVEGLFEVFGDGRAPRSLTPNARQLITEIAADSKRIVWLSDVGADQLVVRMLPRSVSPPQRRSAEE
jgi:hypothetical protein